MAVTTAQRRKALAVGNEIRIKRSRQRRALIGAPAREVIPAIVNPTREMEGIRIATLITPSGSDKLGVVPKIGPKKLSRVFNDLIERYPDGREWHGALRLCDLTVEERRRLAHALLLRAPASWRNGVEA